MQKVLSIVVPGLIVLLLVLGVFSLGFIVVTAVALGAGWLLRLFLPLTLFESTLLGAVLSAFAVYLVIYIVRGFVSPDDLRLPGTDSTDAETVNQEYKKIPAERFYKTIAERTWEAWLRREMANDIYVEFQDAPSTLANVGDGQRQELSIRLADIAIAILKRKTARTQTLTMNVGVLRREMVRMGQRAYDDDILRLALNAINLNLDYYEETLLDLIREPRWDKPATIPEPDEEKG